MILMFAVLILIVGQVSTQDECNNSVTIPYAGQRYYNYRVKEVIVQDFYLKPGWYRAGDEIMPTKEPTSLYICGTLYPIWMNGIHPTIKEGTVNRIACAVSAESSCAIEYDIKVKNCGTYSVYFLSNTASIEEAYCFGIGTEGAPPTFVPPKAVVTPMEVFKQEKNANTTRVHFDCKFEPSTDPLEASLYYQVYWYATRDASEERYVMPEQPKDNLDDLQLTEEIFMNNMKQTLGVNISCAVLPLSGKQGIPGTLSQRSDPFFAGIHVNVIRSIITRGDNGNPGKVSLTSTIPLGCDADMACRRRILAYVPDKDKCKGPAFGNACGTKIFNDRWNSSYEISIVTGNDALYALRGKFDIYLQVESNKARPRIWNNYSLPKFSIEIAESPLKDWQGKICYSHNDPHLKTFDGRSFENQIVGEYILYRHLDFITEVQIKTIECGGIWSSAALCNCGVAVKAGMDVFVLDVCNNRRFIGYQDNLCLESTLDVRKKDNTYTIYLPYDTYITVSFWSHDTRFLNVDVTSSIHDDNLKSTGLCGGISKTCTDDFRMRDGTFSNENAVCEMNPSLQPVGVINEWRVRTNENLFAFTEEVKNNLTSWATYVCACTYGIQSIDPNTTIPCEGHTTQTCHYGPKVGTKTCQMLHQRRRRSVPTIDRFPLPQHRRKRSVLNELQVQVNMTEVEALTYCQDYMKESLIFDLCNNVPSTRSEENINTCAMDILLTKSTVWSNSARESMREQCLNEISRNNTFREDEAASGTIAEIEEKACPSMCSNRGLCDNGTCVCDSGYGSSDCSLDLSEPPEIFGLIDDGLCDENHIECNQAFVYGEIFAEGENLTCRIKPFIMSVDGNRKYETTFYVPAEHETLFEVVCPVQQTRRKKRSFAKNTQALERFVIGYTISVSNDGQRYGRDFDLYMYNSECQLAQNDSGRFTFLLMDGYCFIGHMCVGNGQIHKEDECLICNDKQLKYDWSARDNYEACRNEPGTPQPPALTTLKPNGSMKPIAINLAVIMLSTLTLGITML